MHDAMGVKILSLTDQGNIYRFYSIKSSAEIYRNLIEAWEGESTDRMAAIQYWGLRIFHPIVDKIEKRELWKKVEN